MDDQTVDAFLRSWQFQPTIVLGLLLAAGLFTTGLARLWRRGGVGAVVSGWRAAAFAAGLVAIALALLSPIATFSSLLFSMHMLQHLLLTMFAAPLLLLSRPIVPLLWGFPRSARRALGRAFHPDTPTSALLGWLVRPLPALALQTLTVWGWHLPPLYNASLRSDAFHYLQHAMFLGTALLFWWPVIQPTAGPRRMSYGLTMLYLTGAMVAQTKLLGGLLTFAGQPIYTHYTRVPRVWGISALDDQRVAGLLMFVGGYMMLFLAAAIVFFVWAAGEERRERPPRHGRARSAAPPPDPLAAFGPPLSASARPRRPS